MQLGSTTGLKIVFLLGITIPFFACERTIAPESTDNLFAESIMDIENTDPVGISHMRTFFSIAHQGIAVDDKYIYGIYSYFISVTEKESGKSTSFDFLNSGNTYKDYTDEMNDYVRDDVELMSFNAAVGDAFYFGGFERFRSLMLKISRDGNGTWDCVWEYWNGSHWVELPGIFDGTDCFRNLGSRLILYDFPQNWERVSVNGKEAFYIRARISSLSSMISNPFASWAFAGRYVRNDALPASNHYSDGAVESDDGIQYLYVIGPGDGYTEGKVVRYSIPELGFEGIEYSWATGRGNFSGIDKHKIDGQEYWWIIWDITDFSFNHNIITRFDLDWNDPVDYSLKFYHPGHYNYQGFTWWSNGIDNFIFANTHSPDGTTDLYKWNGENFTALSRLNQVTSDGFVANQGLTWEENSGYLWASARGNEAFSAFKCRVRYNNDGQPTPYVTPEN